MSKDKLEKLREQIHGKQVVFIHPGAPDEIVLDAIFIWEKGGETVSVKPLDYEPEELYIFFSLVWNNYDKTLSHFEDPKYCFTTHPIDRKDEIRKMAQIPLGGEYNFNDIVTGTYGGRPSCPYA
jgi:hypothetical protein